ncbi:GspE/PulE family protein [Anaerohalosphaera lusitana]|nr:GspE/PulE family protein [Anaerohalosphaera lusitana]
MLKQDSLIEYLLEERILLPEKVEEILSYCDQSGQSLLSYLKSNGILDADQLTRAVAAGNSIEFIDLRPDMIDEMAAKLVPAELARQYNLIPVRMEKNRLYLAMSAPLNLAVRDLITTKTGYKVVPVAATEEAVRQAVNCHFNLESVTKQDIVAMRLKGSGTEKSKKKGTRHSEVADAPIVRLVDSIITGGIEARASDIHIEPQEPDMRVRYRVDGMLVEALNVPASAQLEVVSHIKVLAEMDISEKRLPQDGHIAIQHRDKDYDLRVASLPATGGEKVVIRILDASTGLIPLDTIAPQEDDYKRFKSLISNPYGMMLLTGPTGSGKTTTLYSLLQELNTPERNIITVEDPVEYRLGGITQVQIKPDIGLDFAKCLRNILRQDPDIILIGEIRDFETAEIAVSAALTGHLVLSTLHTNDAVGAISRLVSLGIPPFQVASSLLGVVAQRLVRKVCDKCSEPAAAQSHEIAMLDHDGSGDVPEVYKPTGCEVCKNIGYRGRQGIYEILSVSHAIKEMIVDGKSNERIAERAIDEGMKTLRTQGIIHAMEGRTTLEELSRVVDMREA